MSDYIHPPPTYHCQRCGTNTVISNEILTKCREDNLQLENLMTCEGCGDNPEKRELRRKRRIEYIERAHEAMKKMRRELARITQADRDHVGKPFLKCGEYISTNGRQGWMVECSECGEYFRLFEWSFHGKGKKCPGCGYLFLPGQLLYQPSTEEAT